jgi:O-antigen/teichoic acid export membrane protein
MKEKFISFLRWSQKYTKTDMVYVVKGGFWWIFSKISSSFISFIIMIAFAHWLPKETYGTYQFVISVLVILTIFTLPGLNMSLIKSIGQKREGTLRTTVKEKIKWGLLGSLIALALTCWYFLKGNNLLAALFLIVALFTPFKETFRIFVNFWSGRKRFDVQAKYDIASASLSAIFLIPTIYLTNDVLIITAVFLTGQTLFNWLFYFITERQTSNDTPDPEAITFGKHLTLTQAVIIFSNYIDKIIIWKFLGAAPVAVYSFAQLPIEKIVGAIPITPLALSKLGEHKIDKKKKKAILSKFLKLFAISVPTTAILVLVAPFLYKLFFPQYVESIIYFQVLSGLIALSPCLLLTATLINRMEKKALYFVNAGVSSVKIILFLIFIPSFGVWGIIAAILIAEILKTLSALYFFLKI